MHAMSSLSRPLAALALATVVAFAHAADPAPIRRAVDDFLRLQIKGLPGKASYTIGAIDAQHLPNTCNGYDVTPANGARLWGNTQLVVHCRGENWTLQVQARIQVQGQYLVAARPLTAGQRLGDADVAVQNGDLSDLPPGTVTEKELALGRVAAVSLPAGRPLRADMLKMPMVIQQGQGIKIVVIGSGFHVTNEGRALTNASIGQVVQVRLNSGQILSGIARADGSVEVK